MRPFTPKRHAPKDILVTPAEIMDFCKKCLKEGKYVVKRNHIIYMESIGELCRAVGFEFGQFAARDFKPFIKKTWTKFHKIWLKHDRNLGENRSSRWKSNNLSEDLREAQGPEMYHTGGRDRAEQRAINEFYDDMLDLKTALHHAQTEIINNKRVRAAYDEFFVNGGRRFKEFKKLIDKTSDVTDKFIDDLYREAI